MQKIPLEEAIQGIILDDPRYPREAYEFVRESLDHTIKIFKKNASGKERHVTGQELLEGFRRYALEQFGPMAFTVLTTWRLQKCEDVGAVVFNMVNRGVFGKTDEDKLEDFQGGYDFEGAFRRPFEASLSPQRGIKPLNPSSTSAKAAGDKGDSQPSRPPSSQSS